MSWFYIFIFIVLALILVPLSPVYPARISHSSKRKTLIAITFDDGYRCWISDVMPILAKHNLTATAFIYNLDNQKDFTWADAKKLHGAGWEIGWHTSEHKELDLVDSAYIENDFRKSKDLFESNGLPQPITFAFPFGKHDSRSMEIASHFFTAARTIHHGVNIPCYVNDNPYHIKAIRLQNSLSFLKMQLKKCRQQGDLIVFFSHTVGEKADWQDEPEMTVESFEELARFLQQEEQNGNIGVVTFGEGVTQIKKENTNSHWGLKCESPFNSWYRFSVFGIPRRYVTVYEKIIDDFIGHRFPRSARLVRRLVKLLGGGVKA